MRVRIFLGADRLEQEPGEGVLKESIVAAKQEWSTQWTEINLAQYDDKKIMYESANSIELPTKRNAETCKWAYIIANSFRRSFSNGWNSGSPSFIPYNKKPTVLLVASLVSSF